VSINRERVWLNFVITHERYTGLRTRDPWQRKIATLVGSMHFAPTSKDLPRNDVVKIQCFSSNEKLEDLVERVSLANHCTDIHTRRFPINTIPSLRDCPHDFCDFEPRSRGKGEAYPFLEAHYGILPRQVIAIGDQVNDIPMLRDAGLAVVMGNAPVEVKRFAHRVIRSNVEEGVADFIEGVLDDFD